MTESWASDASPELLVTLDRTARESLVRQLERQLRDGVRTGRLAPEARLPSTRALARELGVARGVVTTAYAQLGAEGYLSVRRGSAPRVAAAAATAAPTVEPTREAPPAPRHDLRPDLTDYGSFPRREWLRSVRAALERAADEELGYGDGRGALALRLSLTSYLGRTRGVAAHADRVVVTVGFAHALGLVCATLRSRGARRIALEDPGHAAVRRVVAHAGLQPVPVPVDADGLDVDALAAADVDAVLVTPAHQFPTGAVLSAPRRAALLAWAERRDALVLEDDYDAEFRYDQPPVGALQGLAPERVAFLGSASKTLAPALRLGWAVLPSWLVHAVLDQVHGTIIAPPRLEQLALADFLERGELDRHLRRLRLRYRRRRDALVDALTAELPTLALEGVAAGMHVVARLPLGSDEAAVLEAARARRIALAGMSEHRFDLSAAAWPALLLGYARASEPALRAAVRALADAVG
jgi:GntR family transcriptional regulator/MocR family aminotransferase